MAQLSTSATELLGFRITLLEVEEDKTREIYQTIAESIRKYLAS